MFKFQYNTSGFLIKHLSEITGLSPHVIRKWDQRYDLLTPQRAENGYRQFDLQDLQLLLFIKQQQTAGTAIGQLASQGREALIATMNSGPIDVTEIPELYKNDATILIQAARQHDQQNVDQTIHRLIKKYGFWQALTQIFFPVLRSIGQLWHQGRISPKGERSVSQTIRCLLADDHHLQNGNGKPQAVVACMPQDYHEIGAMAAVGLLRQKGWKATYLGADSSIDIVRLACKRNQGRLVLLSCVVEPDPEAMKYLIDEIVHQLLPITSVAIGGKGASLYIDWIERKGIRYIEEIDHLKNMTPR